MLKTIGKLFTLLIYLYITACSSGSGGDASTTNNAPTASNVSITDNNGDQAIIGDVLAGSYIYADAESDAEAGTTFRWLRNGVAISGATTSTYILVTEDGGLPVTFEVTPFDGITLGSAVSSAAVDVSPVKPLNVQTVPSTQQVTITWDAVTNAASYKIYWNNTGNVTASDAFLDASTSTQFIHNNLSIGSTYYYRVVANSASVEGELSAEVSAMPTTDGWAWVNPTPQGNIIYDMVSFGDLFVAVGEAGSILTSNEGSNWLRQNSGTKKSLSEIHATNTMMVSIGDYNTLRTSTNGISWATPALPTGSSTHYGGITYTGSEWLAVGVDVVAFDQFESRVIRSTDGITWSGGTSVTGVETASYYYRGLASNGTHTIAIDSKGRIFRTDDVSASNWPLVHDNAGAYIFNDITYADNQFVVVGNYDLILTSPDGLTWTQQISGTTGYPLIGVTHDGTQWIVVGAVGRLLTSSDAVTWVNHTSASSTSGTLSAVSYHSSKNKWVAAGRDIISSTDGTTWENHSSSVSNRSINDIAYDGSRYVAVGDSSSIWSSVDGINWSIQSTVGYTVWHSVSHSSGIWVAVGGGGSIVTSPDGDTWTSRSSGTTDQLNEIAHNGSQWLAVSSTGGVFTSPNAVDWTSQTSGTSEWLYGAAHDGSKWVVVGGNGTVLSSADGSIWSSQTSGTTSWLNSIVHNGTQWVAVGNGDQVITSPDAVTWSIQDVVLPHHFNDVVYTGSLWVAVGGFGQIITSADAITWNAEDVPYGGSLEAVVATSSLLVTVGESGTILVRTP